MNKYLNPDKKWDTFGIKSQDEFNSKIIIEGKFHHKVPHRIIEDYIVVERLLSYSYYYYPLIDEAFSKATRIFESAVTLRINDLGLKSKSKFESLDQKIKKLSPYTTPALIKEWGKAKEIRNDFAHPKPGDVKGISIHRAFLQMVNIINTVFLDLQIVQTNELYLEILRNSSKHFFENLLTFDIGNNKILIWSIIPYSCFEIDSLLKSFWVFHPVLLTLPNNIQDFSYIKPICLRLKDVKISINEFHAIDILTGKRICAIVTTDKKNIESQAKYKTMIDNYDKEVKKVYRDYLERELTFEVVKFLYFECWEEILKH